MQIKRYAAIDIGTVTCRMLVADVNEVGAITPLCREYTITNLGESTDETKRLSAQAMERVRAAIARYVEIRDTFDTDEHPIRQTVVMATSAARDAENSVEFEQMLAEFGLELQVIPGTKEAALSFLGATSGCDIDPNKPAMVVDVGGGSTEIAIGFAGAEPRVSHSFNIGCRRATERFFRSDPPALQEIEAATAWMREQFEQWRDSLDLPNALQMVAVAGTATSVVSIREEMQVYDSDRVHNSKVSLEELREVTHRLAELPLDKRRETVGLDPGRAPIIVAGMLVLQVVMTTFGTPAFTVSESDILHGMIIAADRTLCG